MMTRRRFFTLAAVNAATLAAPAVFAQSSSVKEKLQKAYREMDGALVRKDLERAFSFYTPDFVGVARSGQKVTLASARQSFQQILAMSTGIKASTTIQKVTVKGSQAVATVKSTAEFRMKHPQTGQIQTSRVTGVSEDVWVKGAKGWKIKRAKSLSENVTTS